MQTAFSQNNVLVYQTKKDNFVLVPIRNLGFVPEFLFHPDKEVKRDYLKPSVLRLSNPTRPRRP